MDRSWTGVGWELGGSSVMEISLSCSNMEAAPSVQGISLLVILSLYCWSEILVH